MKLFNCNKKIFFTVFLMLIFSQFLYSQDKNYKVNERIKIQSIVKNADRSEFKYIPKKPGHYTAQDWRRAIDSTWGEGLSTTKKLQIFDQFWNDVDTKYPSFFNINVNWDSLKTVYRPEIEAGVSRGRFAGIMSRMSFALLDNHCYMTDLPIATDSIKYGTPIFVTKGNQSMINKEWFNEDYCHFGASLSPLPDSTLLIYDVVPNHPLGLERGDVILGYDGISWKNLYKELIAAELPFSFDGTIGSNTESVQYALLTSAGENWHLFDTIDVIKYKTGNTLHLPTTLMQDKKIKLFSTYQLPIAGVPFPDIDNGHWVSWGIINGTNIGYIYVYNWTKNGDFPYTTVSAGDEFKKAIQDLISKNIDGLIIDSRYNTGGWGDEYPKGLSILFNENQDIYQEYIRNQTDDHYSVVPFYITPEIYNLKINADSYLYDRPIALLISPFSLSAGDLMPLQMRYHPMVRTFGLGTNGAFGSVDFIDITGISTDWEYHLTFSNFKLKDNPNKYLTHLNFAPDEEIEFTKENVVLGKDDVVEKGLEWINNLVYGHNLTKNTGYCRPSIDTLKISALVENPNSHQTSSKVYIKDISGSFIDSVELKKTGISGKSEIWSGNYMAPDIEDFFNISLCATDSSVSKIWVTDNITKFTTVGPISLDSIESTKYPNNIYGIKTFIKNESTDHTINAIKVKLTCDDLWVDSVYPGLRSCPNLPPNQIKSITSPFGIRYDSSAFPGYFNLKFEIMSDNWTYWTDTVQYFLTTVGIDDETVQPFTFKLEQNYPNPFNPTTKIKYSIPVGANGHSPVLLKVYDVLGRKVATLVNEIKRPGEYEVEFNAAAFPSGVYFYQLKSGEFIQTKKMTLLK